jgi:hypothetical protein
MSGKHSHFKDKEAIDHVVEAQAKGLIDSTESHGTEMPGHLSSACDAAKETAIVLPLIFCALQPLNVTAKELSILLCVFAFAWFVWKCGRSALLGWSRLERLHRVLEQEKWEIDHHRAQEREELSALYRAKGFEGRLLEEVMDVLMADEDRLLKVMVEEELGLRLESQDHPLKQGIGAGIGTAATAFLCILGLFLYPSHGIFISGLFVIGAATLTACLYERNQPIPGVIWNLGLGILTFGTMISLVQFFFTH